MTALNCYFTLPTTHYTHYTHFSDETPLQSPLFSPLDHSLESSDELSSLVTCSTFCWMGDGRGLLAVWLL